MLRVTMGKIWCLSKPAIFKKVGKNIFAITFTTKADKLQVVKGKPWLFNNNLLALQDLDGSKQLTLTNF